MEIINDTPFLVEALPLKGPGLKDVLTVIVKGTFDIRAKDRAVSPSEDQMPVIYGDIPVDEDNPTTVKFESDTVPFKPRADIVAVGRAHAPRGKKVQILDAAVMVGQTRKIVRIFGDRKWVESRMVKIHPSDPVPFSSMELSYEKAYGGVDFVSGGWCKQNPIGTGYIFPDKKKPVEDRPLPNIEDHRNLIQTPYDQPMPAGFGFYGKTWEPRVKHMGTYDEKWRKERSPDPPADFKFDFYNGAHPDLQVEGYLKGDESVELLNLSPDGAMSFNLPGIRPSCMVTKSFELFPHDQVPDNAPPKDEQWDESVDLKLDTLCFLPEEKRFYQVWRGLCPVADFRAMEVKSVKIEWR